MATKKLCRYTLRWWAKEMAEKARQKRYVGIQHAPGSHLRGLAYGAAAALEHEVELARHFAREISREARRLESKPKKRPK